MTPKERAAMQQALDALEVHQPDPEQQMVTEAIIALREALAEQAEQEPVAWRCVIPRRTWTFGVDWGREYFENEYEIRGLQGVEPLYAAPVRTKDLTNSEKLYILGSHIDPITKDVMGLSLIDAAIAADREKNK